MSNCLFCKIINKETPADIVYENEKVIAFKDISPKAPIHILIVPKKHITSLKEVKIKDKELLGELFLVAKKIAWDKNLKGYKLIVNVGRKAGQIVDHLHIHLLSGKPSHHNKLWATPK